MLVYSHHMWAARSTRTLVDQIDYRRLVRAVGPAHASSFLRWASVVHVGHPAGANAPPGPSGRHPSTRIGPDRSIRVSRSEARFPSLTCDDPGRSVPLAGASPGGVSRAAADVAASSSESPPRDSQRQAGTPHSSYSPTQGVSASVRAESCIASGACQGVLRATSVSPGVRRARWAPGYVNCAEQQG